MDRMEIRHYVDSWVREELAAYADQKWNDRDANDGRWSEGFMPGAFWRDFIDQYLHRAAVLGIDNPGGRQALLKALVTVHEATVSMLMEFGSAPAPGYPSGEFVEWTVPGVDESR